HHPEKLRIVKTLQRGNLRGTHGPIYRVDQNLGLQYGTRMKWTVTLKASVIDDLRWSGKKDARSLLQEATLRLEADPLAENRNLKTLRPNPVARRALRLFGNYRVLFNLDEDARGVTIVLVGEKRGDSLIVRGEEFTAHHESDPSQ